MSTTTTIDATIETIEITDAQRHHNAECVWVDGTIAGFQFEALCWPDHAVDADYQVQGDSRITKLWLQHEGTTVALFDCSWNIQPKTDAATQIVDLLAAGLAEIVCGN